MKKLLYLFLTVLIVACSGENGVDVHDSCDLESYMVLTESNTGW